MGGGGFGPPPGHLPRELDGHDLSDINQKVVAGEGLRDVLEREYLHAMITIIRGFDRFDYTAYTKDAYFSRMEAEDAKSKILPNGDPGLCDVYQTMQVTVGQLQQGCVRDCISPKTLDSIDLDMIYRDLEINLKGRRG